MRQWLIAGNGRAIVWVKEHGDEGYEDVIVQTCLYNRIADLQCNDGYDWYNAELFAAARRTDYYTQRLLDAYYGVRETRYRERLAGVIGELAFRRSEACRGFIAANWRRELERHQTELAEQHIRLNKKEGYEEVLEFLGTTRKRSLRHESICWGIRYAGEDAIGEKTAGIVLMRFVRKYPCLKPYEPDPSAKAATYDAETKPIEELVELSKRFAPWGMWRLFRKASEEAHQKAVSIAEGCLPNSVRVKFLAVFKHQSYPGSLDKIMDLLDDEDTQFYASYSLAKTKDDRLRKKALQFLRNLATRRYGMTLLNANVEPGDEALILDLISEDRHNPDFDSIYYRLSDIIKSNVKGKWGPVAIFAAEQVPCGNCRGSLYKLSAKYRMLKREDYEAMRYDSDHFTRKWAKKRLRAYR